MEDGTPDFQFHIDAKGLVVLEGLSADETFEYELLAISVIICGIQQMKPV